MALIRLPFHFATTSKARALRAELAACARAQAALRRHVHRSGASSLEHDRWNFFTMGGGTLFCMSALFLGMTGLMVWQGMSGWATTGVLGTGFLVWAFFSERLWRITRATERRASWRKALHSPDRLSWPQTAIAATKTHAHLEGLTVAEAHALLAAQERCLLDAIEIEQAVWRGANNAAKRKGQAQPASGNEAVSFGEGIPSSNAATDSLLARQTRKTPRL